MQQGCAVGACSRGLPKGSAVGVCSSLLAMMSISADDLQEWVASVRVPSEEATALSRMADAAAAAAAFTAEGLRNDHGMLTEQAQRAELAKRAQQASDAVLRGDSDAAGLQEADTRSYSRSGTCTHKHTLPPKGFLLSVHNHTHNLVLLSNCLVPSPASTHEQALTWWA